MCSARPVARILLLYALGAPLSVAAVEETTACAGADLLLVDGHIVTMDDRATLAEAAAVRDGRFLRVGSAREIAPCGGPRTVRLDLKGRTVLPGLIDVHTHALEWTWCTSAATSRSRTAWPCARRASPERQETPPVA